jgi:hypothetical protein
LREKGGVGNGHFLTDTLNGKKQKNQINEQSNEFAERLSEFNKSRAAADHFPFKFVSEPPLRAKFESEMIGARNSIQKWWDYGEWFEVESSQCGAVVRRKRLIEKKVMGMDLKGIVGEMRFEGKIARRRKSVKKWRN